MNNIFSFDDKIEEVPLKYKGLPAEIFLASYEQEIDLFSFSSSTLMYASSLMGIKSYQCLDALIDFSKNDKLINYRLSVAEIFTNHSIEKWSIEK